MSALYAIIYAGRSGDGQGAIFVGRGQILGYDFGSGRYAGTYHEQDGRLKGTVALSFPAGGTLVTGQRVPPNAMFTVAIDWPSDFGNGTVQHVIIDGQAVGVVFDKIGGVA